MAEAAARFCELPEPDHTVDILSQKTPGAMLIAAMAMSTMPMPMNFPRKVPRRTTSQVKAIEKSTFSTPLRDAVSTSIHRDRKSTRLNSSHGYISYAVFCLKKKIY